MIVKDNLLLFENKLDLNTKQLNRFFDRLKLFLLIDFNAIRPKLVVSANVDTLRKFSDSEIIDFTALYDESTHTIVVNKTDYKVGNEFFNRKVAQFVDEEDISKYRYIVPLSDLYHELIHHVQYCYGNYDNMDMLEGSADTFSYILTGQPKIDYARECVALWYIARKILKLNIFGYYTFISKIICNQSYPNKILFHNKSFLKLLSKEFNNNVALFLRNIKKNYGDLSYQDKMFADLNSLHKLIFETY